MTFKSKIALLALLIASTFPSITLAKQSSLTGTITKITGADGEYRLFFSTNKKTVYVADVTNAYIIARGRFAAAPELLRVGDAVSITGFITGADIVANTVKTTAPKKTSPAARK